MSRKRITVKPHEIGPGYYVAFGSGLGAVGFFRVDYNASGELIVWGLSRWAGKIAYRTHGLLLSAWLEKQPAGAQYRIDKDREGWPE